ncbi:MAG: hypothetical protein QM530_01755 [Phycisphaerales bacterium]|nr:hypothetical protein [Phycisphaerales bacterium]
MPKKYFHLIAIILTLSVLACNKPDSGFEDAAVENSGDITVDGCGYLLRFSDGRKEKPYQLLSAYQRQGMLVKVKYHVSEVLDTCGATKPYFYYKLIIVDDIKMRQ